jgi:hypothetical protein
LNERSAFPSMDRPQARAAWSGPIAAVLVVLIVGPAGADEGLYLRWNDCALSGSALVNQSRSCTQDFGEEALFCAFTVPQAIDSVIALQIIVDVQLAGPLPAWWQFYEEGCRPLGMGAGTLFPANGACNDFWNGDAGTVVNYDVGLPHGLEGQARIRIDVVVPAVQYRRLEVGEMYYAARLALRGMSSTTCAGCIVPACLVLNSILIGRLPGALDVPIERPGPNFANRATWQGGANCEAVPTRVSTWGALKALYR